MNEQNDLARLLARLARAHKLEVAARDQVEQLMEVAWEIGANDRDVAEATGMSHDAARMRRRRAGLRVDGRKRQRRVNSRPRRIGKPQRQTSRAGRA